MRRQCELLNLDRSTYYYPLRTETRANLDLMRAIDLLYLKRPYFGSRRIGVELGVNRKRVQRLMRVMGLEAIYPKPCTSHPGAGHKIYPYLLRKTAITHPDHVWSTDITYIPLERGYLYLTAVIDWFSRYVLAWRLSNSLEGTFCCEALDAALTISQPEIFNTDQGTQFTSRAFTSRLLDRDIQISMDGRGRALDNAFVERLWRTVKYEEVHLQEYEDEVGASEPESLLAILQPGAEAFVAEVSHPGRSVLRQPPREFPNETKITEDGMTAGRNSGSSNSPRNFFLPLGGERFSFFIHPNSKYPPLFGPTRGVHLRRDRFNEHLDWLEACLAYKETGPSNRDCTVKLRSIFRHSVSQGRSDRRA